METVHQGESTPLTVSPKLLHDVQVLVSRLVAKAPRLIKKFTTNLAEAWMHIRCKFDGGKVVNRIQSGSWQHRCMGAGLQPNLGAQWTLKTWSEMTASQPNAIFEEVTTAASKKAECDRKRKATDEAKTTRRQNEYSRSDNSMAARKAYT